VNCRAAAHTGPGRKRPEAWPPRKKVGAGERCPSAPRLEPSIVKERGGEAPRDRAGEPHSPVPLPFGEDFASFKDLFASHSPLFEPFEAEKKRRELRFERREELFVRHSPAFEPPEGLFASHSPSFESSEDLFGFYSPELEWLEEQGTRREEEGMPREEWGMRRCKLFA
jgi:hypothetical protein